MEPHRDIPQTKAKLRVPVQKKSVQKNQQAGQTTQSTDTFLAKVKFGVRLKRAREQKGWTLQEFGTYAGGISAAYINDIEHGRKYPSLEIRFRLAAALNVKTEQLEAPQSDADGLLEAILDALPAEEEFFQPYKATRQDFAELLTRQPTLLAVILKGCAKIARAHDFGATDFFYALLSAHLEEGKFAGDARDSVGLYQDIEDTVKRFRRKSGIKEEERAIRYPRLKDILKKGEGNNDPTLNFALDDTSDFTQYDNLAQYIRSVRIPEKPVNLLVVNKNLSAESKAFQILREIGFRTLDIQKVNPTSPPSGEISFPYLWGDLRASMFAGAVLMNRKLVEEDMNNFFKKESWDEQEFRRIIDEYKVTPEMFLYRLAQILPEKPFELKHFHFLRFERVEYQNRAGVPHDPPKGERDRGRYELSLKSLNAGEIPFSTSLSQREKYCRRFLAIKALRSLDKICRDSKNRENKVVIDVQRSLLVGTEKEFFCLTVARPLTLSSERLVSVTLGFSIDDHFRRTVRFWNSADVAHVGSTCERCPLPWPKKEEEASGIDSCSDRAPGAADYHLYERKAWQDKRDANLIRFIEEKRKTQQDSSNGKRGRSA